MTNISDSSIDIQLTSTPLHYICGMNRDTMKLNVTLGLDENGEVPCREMNRLITMIYQLYFPERSPPSARSPLMLPSPASHLIADL